MSGAAQTQNIIEAAYARHDAGDSAGALRLIEQALQALPGDAALRFARGNVLRESGDETGAEAEFRAVIEADPAHAKAHNNLGAILLARGELEGAQARFEQALAHAEQFAEAAFNLGAALQRRYLREQALPWFERALAWRPGYAAAGLHMGQVLSELGRLDEAEAALRASIAAAPEEPGAYNDLGLVLLEMSRLQESAQAHERAVALSPASDEFKTNLGLSLMQLGELGRAWALYDHRWRADGQLRPAYRYDPALEWRGGPLTGRRLRLWWEQGMGDTLCFSRFLPQLAQKFSPAAVSLECQRGLSGLMRHSFPAMTVFEMGEAGPDFDLHLPMASLPGRCGVSTQNLATAAPYLAPTPAALARWGARVGQLPGPRVGVVWTTGLWPSGASPPLRERSVPADLFGRLFKLPGISFVSLQKGAGEKDAARFAERGNFFDWAADIASFDDTAAIIASLDLVITVDTSVLHLAGALGRPTWVLLRDEGGNLWVAGEEKSLWYPHVRVFRQRQKAQWEEVMDRAVQALRDFAARAGGA